MSAKFSVIERGEPGVAGGGTKKFYTAVKNTGEYYMEKLIKAIEKISTVSSSGIRAVLYAPVDVASDQPGNSRIVRPGEPGSLRMSVSSHGLPAAEAVNASAIKNSKFIFIPGKRLSSLRNTLTFRKVS